MFVPGIGAMQNVKYRNCGVVVLSQIERDLPTVPNAEARDFKDLACCSIAKIRLFSLDVTTPGSEI